MRNSVKTWLLLCSIAVAGTAMFWPAGQIPEEVKGIVVQGGELVQSRLLTGVVQYEQKQHVFSRKSGLIGKIHALPDQEVQAGDLLIQMDTAAEEKMLAQLYHTKAEQTSFIKAMGSTAILPIIQSEAEIQENITAFSSAVQRSAIRAETEGIVEVWYVQEGDVVSEGTPMGIIRGNNFQVCAYGYLFGAKPGMTAQRADGRPGQLVLKKVSSTDASGVQTLIFDVQKEANSYYEIGETVEIEVISETKNVDALIPLSAVEADGSIWYVEDGMAQKHVLPEDAACGRMYYEGSGWWLGKVVIDAPQQYGLYAGKPVRVKK